MTGQSADRGPHAGLVTGVGEVAPGGVLLPHHHEPEETYYVVGGRGEIDGVRTDVGPETAVFIPRTPGTPCIAPAGRGRGVDLRPLWRRGRGRG